MELIDGIGADSITELLQSGDLPKWSRATFMTDVTQILSQIEHGDAAAAERLLPLIYDELRKLASVKLAHEKPGQTLQATALVHEAYLRLVGSEQSSAVGQSRSFLRRSRRGDAADSGRKRSAQGEYRNVAEIAIELNSLTYLSSLTAITVDLLALDEALRKLEAEQPRNAQLIKLRYFAGCTLEETAQILGISRATAQRNWAYARAWLYGQLSDR